MEDEGLALARLLTGYAEQGKESVRATNWNRRAGAGVLTNTNNPAVAAEAATEGQEGTAANEDRAIGEEEEEEEEEEEKEVEEEEEEEEEEEDSCQRDAVGEPARAEATAHWTSTGTLVTDGLETREQNHSGRKTGMFFCSYTQQPLHVLPSVDLRT
ncbi:hypothetical protein F2P81_003451 [Scophthalmus maximus]|uniref:Uncharacterized protein n=1 Tax=Scophthalmus maximus TaxID=52904 RepID=A0A6A4TE89_SCOMX|nr:hypothetical protein F2P81_003451 [Scophthalmus maximus]